MFVLLGILGRTEKVKLVHVLSHLEKNNFFKNVGNKKIGEYFLKNSLVKTCFLL